MKYVVCSIVLIIILMTYYNKNRYERVSDNYYTGFDKNKGTYTKNYN